MSTPQQQLVPYIHHEKQEKGSMLCAQHALNCLLQGQYYDASQLAQIAAELDALEASELGLSAHDIATRDRSSLNMDDTGFFSLSVLERALQVWGLTIVNWRSADMRSHHSTPEDQKAFILNLDSHWFTIRAFGSTNKFWYNLNSFLAEPSWIGNNYLGTLLHTAESEGYTVFVIQPDSHSSGQGLQESDADQIADHLPAPGTSSSNAATAGWSATTSSLGLRPSQNGAGVSAADVGLADEDAELQAALSASLADGANAALTAQPMLDSPGGRSRVRHTRSGSDDSPSASYGPGYPEETDADIDAIAPSRRRHRPEASYTPTEPRDLPSEPIDDDLRRALEASLASSSATASNLNSSSDATTSSSASAAASSSRPLGRRKRRAQEQRSGLSREDAIDLDDPRDVFGGDDGEELRPSSLAHRSPFLSPAMAAANRDNEDVEEIIDDDDELPSDDDVVDPFSIAGAPEASAVLGPRQDRHYDDEDAELQAALAASLGDTEAAERFAAGAGASSRPQLQAEDEAPVPADVDKIFRMREEARKKAQEERERQERLDRGEIIDEPGPASAGAPKAGDGSTGDEDDEGEDAEEEDEAVSAEEMRRRRLARFG
ncbi:Josephin-domain-containing protein [Testicularia cyperi]|uniref:ubiquitinyl hydrolase 1 n=1 Tax=Testicularia cyperi TaxID=1882483 RepID=A0A317XR24_9BASI|nr:Josephin-domain-containing protein [Testicularia cyperi]